jgi:hypothetical protein
MATYDDNTLEDRMTPGVSGALAGFAAGLAALGVIHFLDSGTLAGPIVDAASARGVDPMTAFAIGYVTAGAGGAIVGTGFGIVTRYLRRWGPLAIWALVFFSSVALVILAVSSIRGAPAILAATAAFAVVVSLSLPIRRVR